MVPRLEALADAIIQLSGWPEPSSPVYQARNPLCLKDYGNERQPLREFSGFHNGYDAAVYDLRSKCSGRTRAKLVTRDLTGLMRVYSMPDSRAFHIAKFLQSALNNPKINAETRLEYFLL